MKTLKTLTLVIALSACTEYINLPVGYLEEAQKVCDNNEGVAKIEVGSYDVPSNKKQKLKWTNISCNNGAVFKLGYKGAVD